MQKRSHIATVMVALMSVTCSAGFALAQTAPAAGTDATPPATAAPAATTPAPAASPAPAATPAPAASPAAAPSSVPTETKEAKPPKKKKRMTRQQEIDHSIESGTVPSRYRSSVPKEYQKYIPFEKK